MLARVMLLQGFADQAINQAMTSLEEGRATRNELSLCWVLHYALCPVTLMTGDLIRADQAVATFMDLSTRLNANFWKVVARCLKGKLLIKRGEFLGGVNLLRSAIGSCETTGWTICYPEFLGALAEGLAGLGQITEALVTVDRALTWADQGGECWYVPELLRLKGEFLLRSTEDWRFKAAEDYFKRALGVAGEQGALYWELRVAISLAGLRLVQHRPHDARQILEPVYNRFTEGFETADLRSARATLELLSPRARLNI
jgi:predicted ATPase